MKIILCDDLTRTKLKYYIVFDSKKFVLNQPLEESYREGKLQPDEEIVFPQDDLYKITWETNFGDQSEAPNNEPIRTN